MFIYILIAIQLVIIMILDTRYNLRKLNIGTEIHEKIHLYSAKILGMKAKQNKITSKIHQKKGILGEVTVEKPNFFGFFSGVAPLFLPVIFFSLVLNSYLNDLKINSITNFSNYFEILKKITFENPLIIMITLIFLVVIGNQITIISKQDINFNIPVAILVIISHSFSEFSESISKFLTGNNLNIATIILFLIAATYFLNLFSNKLVAYIPLVLIAILSAKYYFFFLNVLAIFLTVQLIALILEMLIFRNKDYSLKIKEKQDEEEKILKRKALEKYLNDKEG